jgi:hypothetical protein
MSRQALSRDQRPMHDLSEPQQPFSTETHKHGDLTRHIIRIFYDVYNTLGHGFLQNKYNGARGYPPGRLFGLTYSRIDH